MLNVHETCSHVAKGAEAVGHSTLRAQDTNVRAEWSCRIDWCAECCDKASKGGGPGKVLAAEIKAATERGNPYTEERCKARAASTFEAVNAAREGLIVAAIEFAKCDDFATLAGLATSAKMYVQATDDEEDAHRALYLVGRRVEAPAAADEVRTPGGLILPGFSRTAAAEVLREIGIGREPPPPPPPPPADEVQP